MRTRHCRELSTGRPLAAFAAGRELGDAAALPHPDATQGLHLSDAVRPMVALRGTPPSPRGAGRGALLVLHVRNRVGYDLCRRLGVVLSRGAFLPRPIDETYIAQ